MRLIDWLHKKFNNQYMDPVHSDLLAHLAEHHNERDFYLNYMLVIPDMLNQHDKTSLIKAKDELISCGFAGCGSTLKSQIHITPAGKAMLQQYNRFRIRPLLRKMTWWFTNHCDGPWKITRTIMLPVGIIGTIISSIIFYDRLLSAFSSAKLWVSNFLNLFA
jgi:hypothetical protein